MQKFFTTRNLCISAIIAALYTALTLAFQAISFGAVQFRISEALTLLPVVLPQAVPGLAIGCLLSNLLAGANIYDVVFGTLATMTAAVMTWRIRGSVWVRALPPVLCNAVIIGLVITYAYGVPTLWLNMLTVGLGQAVVCFALGVPMVKLLEKQNLLEKIGGKN
ncbi:MAG: QueT transporter family protein [Clostridiales bacterium]|nr:QueT transporter family protein [Clostridiales bacterium]